MKKMKTIIVGILAIAMVFTAMVAMPQTADATETMPDAVCYDNTLDIADYWNSSEPTVPTKENYVFGGWFTYAGGEVNAAETTYTALTKAELVDMDLSTLTNVCAKFVPAYVLSIKVQIDVDTKKNSTASSTNSKGEEGYAFLRLLSSVDTNKYAEIGFDLFYDKTAQESNESTKVTKVFSKLTNAETANGEQNDGWTPADVFGSAAKYFSVLRVDDISAANCDNILYVRPYWVTHDGTRVTGQSKYVRVMDGYATNEYISVPVNLMTGGQVAAGMLDLTYDSRLEVVEYEEGLLLPEMSAYKDPSDTSDTTDTIKLVGNVSEAGQKEPETDIYANVWFKETTPGSIGEDEILEFTVGNYTFCNWSEAPVDDVKAWNVQYK